MRTDLMKAEVLLDRPRGKKHFAIAAHNEQETAQCLPNRHKRETMENIETLLRCYIYKSLINHGLHFSNLLQEKHYRNGSTVANKRQIFLRAFCSLPLHRIFTRQIFVENKLRNTT